MPEAEKAPSGKAWDNRANSDKERATASGQVESQEKDEATKVEAITKSHKDEAAKAKETIVKNAGQREGAL